MTALQRSVLIVEDEFLIAMSYSEQAEDMGLMVCGIAATAADAISKAKLYRPAIVLMDMRLDGEGDGVDAALKIHESVGSRVIFITGSREQSTVDRINSDHPYAILFKPVSNLQFQGALSAAIENPGEHAGR